MEKIYRILELTSTSLESRSVSEEYGYGQKTLHSYLYRNIDDTEMDYNKRSALDDGFDTLEDADQFIAENIGKYDLWTVVCEYRKSE